MHHPTLSYNDLSTAVRDAVAIRAVLRLQPAGGPGSKVFPPTYGESQDKRDRERFGETKYAVEKRRIEGRTVDCVLLDSVASQANRMELALRKGWEDGALLFPVVTVDFSDVDLPERFSKITALDAPHRIYDAILRDSVDAEGMLFRYTTAGQEITAASPLNATALYKYCPTALIFGAWDSTGPKGGMGSKFQRTLSSEIVAIDAQTGARVGSRIDPLGIVKVDGVVYKQENNDGWDIEPPNTKAKAVPPSEVNHGNVTPTRVVDSGGITCDHARQTTVLSLPALRRLKFPRTVDGGIPNDQNAAESAAHAALAALALAGISRAHAEGYDLRSGTLLVPEGPLVLEVLSSDGAAPQQFVLPAADADRLVQQAAAAAAEFGMGWDTEPIPPLRPADKLVHLLRESQTAQARKAPQSGEDA